MHASSFAIIASGFVFDTQIPGTAAGNSYDGVAWRDLHPQRKLAKKMKWPECPFEKDNCNR